MGSALLKSIILIIRKTKSADLVKFMYFSIKYRYSTEALEGHFNLLIITYYLLLITYHLLLITYYLLLITYYLLLITYHITGPRSAVSNVSGNRCESDCRSRGRKFDPGPVPYFRGD